MFAKCNECGKELRSNKEANDHFHAVTTVSKEDRVYLINLPDGCAPGRWEAAEAFAEAVAELRTKCPSKSFTFTPFDHEKSTGGHGGIDSWLAIAS